MVPAGTHLANAVVLYNSRGESLEPVREAKPVPDRTFGAEGRRPNSAINPHAHKGVSTFGNTAARRLISLLFSYSSPRLS